MLACSLNIFVILQLFCMGYLVGDLTPLPTCSQDQVEFVYTPCDNHDNTWRVQVPTDNTCLIESPAKPISGVKCSKQCKPGEYLDIQSQECAKCQAGYYSLGDGQRFSSWDVLPAGFKSRGFSDINSYEKNHKAGVDDPCYHSGWNLKGTYLESNGSACRSVLKFETELIKPGNISFTIKSASDNALFHVWVEKNGCSDHYNSLGSSPNDDDHDNNENYYTPTQDWETQSLSLKKGQNTIYFVASHFSNVFEYSGGKENGEGTGSAPINEYESQAENTVMMKDIIVRGYAYSLQCAKCEAGTMSEAGASSCETCAADHYSVEGSDRCLICPSTKYSFPHSRECLESKPCTNDDFHELWETCKNDKTRKSFNWTLPHICDENHAKSVKLPTPGAYIKCPGCNPGFFNNGSGTCLACPKNHFSVNGEGECHKCPPQTRSVPKLHFKYWKNYPGNMVHLYCLARPETGCKTNGGWTLHDDYISSGLGHADDAELLMYVIVPGFTKRKSEFKMTFSIICPSKNCRLRIQTVEAANMIQDIKKYDGSATKTTFTHTRHSAEKTRYRITFEKKYNPNAQTYKYTDSSVNIYEIEISDVKDGGAEKCESCKDNQESCIKCEPGSYIGDGRCIKCPQNTYSTGYDNIVGVKSCKKCPMYTVSAAGSTSCHSHCLISTNSGDAATAQTFNLTALSGQHVVNAAQRFTTKGYNYHHSYFISICGQPYKESTCVNNATGKSDEISISAAICRTTIIPDENKLLSAQPLNIGQSISSIEVNSTVESTGNNTEVSVASNGNILFKFYSRRYTAVCDKGTQAHVTLVCDQTKPGEGMLKIGDEHCPHETCDGCTYHFTWETIHACARCTENDYKVIQGACKKGKKTKHHVWKENRNCVGGIDKPEDITVECSIFEKSILDFKLVILGFLVAGLLLAIIVIVLCYRNRSLSYKYSRLIDAGQSKDGELPASEICAYEEGEEEDDEVVLARTKGRKPKILDRLKGIGKKKTDFSEFETINLDSIKNMSDDDDEDDEI